MTEIRKRKKISSRIFSICMALLMFLSMTGLENIVAHAINPDDFKVDSVTIYKIYNRNRNLETRRVLIIGSSIKDAEVGIVAAGTGYHPLTNRTVNSESILQFDLSSDQLGNSIMIEGIEIPLNEANMPTLSGVTRQVERGAATPSGKIVLQGSNFNEIGSAVTAKYEPLDGGLNSFNGTSSAGGDEYTASSLTGGLGLQNIIFEKVQTENIDFPDNLGTDVEVTVTYNYKEQFRLVESLSNMDDLKMFPNRGESGDKVYFTGDELDEYDVFFLTDINGTDPYTNQNKGKNKTFLADSGDVAGEDVLTVEVPNIVVGEYYVVLTNAVADDKDPMQEVNQVHIVRVDNSDLTSDEEKFYVIDGSTKSSILIVQPNSGPDSGQEITISGEFLGTMNIPEFTPAESITTIEEDPSTDPDQEKLDIIFSPEGSSTSVGTYNDFDVTKVTRTISITIGDRAKFVPNSTGNKYDYSFTSDLDTIKVLTPQVNDAEDDPTKDVVAEIETVFEINGGLDRIIIKERAELVDGYTYIPSKITPTIEEVVPEKIQVGSNGTDFEIEEDLLIGIYGENFAIHKYIDESGDENLMYPQIELGEIVLNKSFSKLGSGEDNPNYNPDVDIRVFNNSGEELDGTEGNEIGTKILITIPGGTTITTTGKTFARITNPVRNSKNMGLANQKNNAVEFVIPAGNKIPVINSVDPNVVTSDGGEEVTITGSNFQDGVMVFIDGAKVENVERSEDGKEITFTSPAGREGDTQLIVMNIEGGMDTYPFTYVKTYTNPQIDSFSPKQGKTGTLVVINGDNFLKPDPTADEDNILRLIGTRIFLEGVDISTYNLDPNTKKVILEDYAAPSDEQRILTISDEEVLKLQDYYHSIVLHEDDSKMFYTIDVDSHNRPYITNGVNERYNLSESSDGSQINAEREGGGSFTLIVKNDDTGDYIELTDGTTTKTLRIKTPFKVEDNIIIGDNVKVIDKNKIYFTVPVLQTDGYYDLSVVNPDTKKDTKKDQEGFYYFRQPQSKPQIDNIEPSQGSTEGGYTILISGSEFLDNGSSKTKVIINGLEVEEEDITINSDGTEITVIVPPYQGDLAEDMDTDRITVPVVVVNPDGGSDSIENGFTYVIPTSNPEIVKIVPENGNASGGDIVEITGSDFRFFEPFDDLNRDQTLDPNESYEDVNGDGKWNNEEQIGTEDGWTEPVEFDHEIYNEYYSSPILPKIYFGDRTAKIVEFSTGYLKVILPPGTAGTVDVHVVNNDSGISNKVSFTYDGSNPTITTVVPDEGKKQGKDSVEIKGTKFQKSYISVYDYDSDGDIIKENKSMVLVNFARITNKDIARDEENSGLINNSRTTVELDGNLRVEYDGTNNTLKPFIEVNDTIYQIPGGITDYHDTENYIPLSMLKDSEGNPYSTYELIRVFIEDRRLIVERGYSPEVESISSEHIIVNTPSYYTIGTVPLYIINPDGGEAEAEFTYRNPDSSPEIINITKEGREPVEKNGVKVLEVTYKGGNIVSIYGEDFREGAIIQISDILTINEDDITYQLPDRLTFTMPAVPESAVGDLHRVVVKNTDGGIASSNKTTPMAIYIQFIKGETFPEIGNLTPDKGPSTGGTKVTISGEDFRNIINDNKFTVYFGDVQVPEKDVELIDYKTIVVYSTPPHEPGTVEVKIENPDGALSDPVGTFTYISTPKIISVTDEEDNKIYTISVEGGETIKVHGSGFDGGTRVVFNPVLTEITDEDTESGEVVYIGEDAFVLEEGTEAAGVEYIDSETLEVTTPEGKLGELTIMVINPDNGASDVYSGLEYGLPDVAAPGKVTATLMYDKYIRVEWSSVSDAAEYEVYVTIDDGGAEYVGSTDSTFFVYQDLDERTDYKFLIRSVGEYGLSSEYGESNTVETGRDVEGYEDKDGEIAEDTTTKMIGSRIDLTIGTSDYDDANIELDLTRTEFAGVNEVYVSMPAAVISSHDARDISIVAKEFSIKLNPKTFYNSTIREKKSKEDAGVRFKISFNSKALQGAQKQSSEGYLSDPVILEAQIFDGSNYEDLEYLNAFIEIALDYDLEKVKMRRYKRVELGRYDEYEGTWESIAYRQNDYAINVRTLTNRLGKYSVIGRR